MSQGTGSDRADAAGPIIDEAGRQLRAPWAVSVAGLLFAALFTAARPRMRTR
jgi:hypothetical protein